MRRVSFVSVLVAVFLGGPSLSSQRVAGDSQLAFDVLLDPGAVDRSNWPVSVDLDVAALGIHEIPHATLRDGEGRRPGPVQVEWGSPARNTLRLTWIHPVLVAGEPVRLRLTFGPRAAAAAGFSFRDGEGCRDVLFGGRGVLRHVHAWDPTRYEKTYKHFHHVWTLDGEAFLTKGPGGRYSHHRGLFLGWNRTRRGDATWDFWHCRDRATVRHLRYVSDRERSGPVCAQQVVEAGWLTPAEDPVVKEIRTVRVFAPRAGCLRLDFDVILEGVGGRVELRGDPHHAGFHFRAVNEVNARRQETVYLRSAGAQRERNDIWTNCAWVACLFERKSRPYAVAHFDHPANPRPMRYSTRDYGRFGSFFPLDLDPGKPVRLRWRVMIVDRERMACDAAFFEREFRGWTAPVVVRVKRAEGR